MILYFCSQLCSSSLSIITHFLFMVNHPQTMSEAENTKWSLLNQQVPWKMSLKNTLLLGQQRREKFLPRPDVQMMLLMLLVTQVHSCTSFLCLTFVLKYTLIKYPFSWLSLVSLADGIELLWLITIFDYLSAVNRVCWDIWQTSLIILSREAAEFLSSLWQAQH